MVWYRHKDKQRGHNGRTGLMYNLYGTETKTAAKEVSCLKACSYPAKLNTAKLIVICCFRILDFTTSMLLSIYTATLSSFGHKFGIPKVTKLAKIVFKSQNEGTSPCFKS
jgi:hypothetical protein